MEIPKRRPKKIKGGKLIIPVSWIEMNPKDAKNAKNIAICVDGIRVGVYYTDANISNLTAVEMAKINTYAEIFDFSQDYRIYGLIESEITEDTLIHNVDNAELIRN